MHNPQLMPCQILFMSWLQCKLQTLFTFFIVAWTQIENPETLRTFWNNQNENKVIIRVGLSFMKYD